MNRLVAFIVVVFVVTQIYSVLQSYAGRADVIDGLRTDCLAEARVRADIALDSQTATTNRVRLLSISAPTEGEREALCRMQHPSPSFRPWK